MSRKKKEEEEEEEAKSRKKEKNKKRRRKGGGNVEEKKKKRVKNSSIWTKPMCKCTRAFLSIKQPYFLLQFFFFILGRKLFDGSKEKTLGFYYLFFFLPTKLNTLQKVFILISSSKFSIHFISPPNKHTLRVHLVEMMKKWENKKQ